LLCNHNNQPIPWILPLAQLLYILPALGTHTTCVAPVLRTISSLASVRSLHPISVRLLGRLWDSQPRVFPRLQAALNEYHPEKMDDDLRISIASVIRFARSFLLFRLWCVDAD
jgi:hypothetical protein